MFPHRHVKRIRERRVLSGSQKRGFLKWRAASTSTSPVLDIFSVNLATIKSNSLSIPISIKCTEENQTVETLGLIDSGARGKFIDQNFTKTIGLKTQSLEWPITTRNIDGTENKHGRITCFTDVNLTIHGRTTKTRLLVTGLGKQKIILGFPWLNKQNPDIDWKIRRFDWRNQYPGLARLLRKRSVFEEGLKNNLCWALANNYQCSRNFFFLCQGNYSSVSINN